MQFVTPIPFDEALQKLGTRSPVTSVLKSADWRAVPVELRERAFFSATVENARFLQNAQNEIRDFLAGARDVNEAGQSYLKTGSRAEFIDRMREFAIQSGMGPLDPGDEKTLKDIRSESRLALIFDTQVKAAQDYGYYKQGQDPDILDAFPAQRFIRVTAVAKPRPDHAEHEGDVRRKDDTAYWLARNPDFNVPWGPWGFNSGMDVEDVGRDEAEELGLVSKDEVMQPAGTAASLNADLQASTQGLSDHMARFLELAFGDQVKITGDRAEWAGRD